MDDDELSDGRAVWQSEEVMKVWNKTSKHLGSSVNVYMELIFHFQKLRCVSIYLSKSRYTDRTIWTTSLASQIVSQLVPDEIC